MTTVQQQTRDALLDHEWTPGRPETAHRAHKFHAFCEICTADLDALVEFLDHEGLICPPAFVCTCPPLAVAELDSLVHRFAESEPEPGTEYFLPLGGTRRDAAVIHSRLERLGWPGVYLRPPDPHLNCLDSPVSNP